MWSAPALVALGLFLAGARPSTDRMATLAARAKAHQDTLLTAVFGGVAAWLLAEGIVAVG